MVSAIVNQRVKPIKERLSHLKLFQSLYLIALLLMLAFAMQDAFEEGNVIFVGMIALAALAIELWPKFVAIWETLLGRVVIILSYAIIGNFAVAFASQKLNEIVGIDPSPLFYSISFATLLMAPIWILTMTLLAMALYTIAIQIGVLLKVTLKKLRLIKNEDDGMRYPVTTAFTRLILMPAMFMTLVSAIDSYGGDATARVVDEQGQEIESKSLISAISEEFSKSQRQSAEPEVAEQKLPENESSDSSPSENNQAISDDTENDSEDKNADANEDVNKVNLDRIIAAFVHHVELFKYSQCIKTKKEHVIYIGDSDILVSKYVPDSRYGYEFSVRPCTLKSY